MIESTPAIRATILTMVLASCALVATGCGSSRAPSSKSAESMGSGDAAPAEAPPKIAQEEPGAEGAAADGEAAEEEDAMTDADGMSPAQTTSESSYDMEGESLKEEKSPQKSKKDQRTSLTEGLEMSVAAFDNSLDAEDLSCDGALPHREAICSIAKRLCDLKDALSGKRPCTAATESCEQAKKRFKEKCGS